MQDNSFESPMAGGSYTEGIVGTVAAMNPLLSQRNEAEDDVVSLVYSGLTKYDPLQRKVVPDLATYEINNDSTEFTFHINSKAKFHDDTKVTADDVIFTYSLISKDGFPNNVLKNRFANVHIKKVDESTVQFTLPNRYYYFPSLTTIGILPKHLWEQVPMEDFGKNALNLSPVGSGPYEVEGQITSESSDNAQIVHLTRFDDYYGELPYLDEITLQFFPTFDEVLAKKGALTGIKSIPVENLDDIKSYDRFVINETFVPKYFALFLNLENPILKNVKVRQALSLAVSRENLLQKYSFLRAINSPFLGRDTENWQSQFFPERAKGGLFDAGWKMPDDAMIKKEKIELTKQYLAETGSGNTLVSTGTVLAEAPKKVEPGKEGEKKPEEKPKEPVIPDLPLESMKIGGRSAVDIMEDFKKMRHNSKLENLELKMVTLDSPLYLQEMSQNLVQEFSDVGVKVNLEVISSSEINDVIKDRNYDIIFIGQEIGYDGDVFAYWHSLSAKRSGFNLSNLKNDQVDKLLESIRSPKVGLTEDEQEDARSKKVDEISKIFRNEMPAIFLFQQKEYFAVDKKYRNVNMSNIVSPKDRFAGLHSWYEKVGRKLKTDFTFTNFSNWVIKNLN